MRGRDGTPIMASSAIAMPNPVKVAVLQSHRRTDILCEPYSSGNRSSKSRSSRNSSSWNTRQPNRFLANAIAGNDAERRPRAGKVRLACAKDQRTKIKPIFVNETEFG